jgi:cell wall-associated NlpC family hydrolase
VQEGFRDLGLAVPRDTDMQREAIGSAVVIGEPDELWRNDLIYVPGHVMICAGEGTVIHAYGGDMRVRRDELAELMATNGWSFADFTIRRP